MIIFEGVMKGHVVLLMILVAVRLVPAYGTLGKPNLHHCCNYIYIDYRLLIIFFAILVCVCVACCRRCYCNQSNYSSNRQVAITVGTNVQPMEHSHRSLSSSGSGYNKSNIDAPPSYFDVTPNYIQQNDLPPPYPGENNT